MSNTKEHNHAPRTNEEINWVRIRNLVLDLNTAETAVFATIGEAVRFCQEMMPVGSFTSWPATSEAVAAAQAAPIIPPTRERPGFFRGAKVH